MIFITGVGTYQYMYKRTRPKMFWAMRRFVLMIRVLNSGYIAMTSE